MRSIGGKPPVRLAQTMCRGEERRGTQGRTCCECHLDSMLLGGYAKGLLRLKLVG